MRYLTLTAIVGIVLGLALVRLAPSAAGPASAVKKAEPSTKTPDDWKEDRVCRMVFFAVLEGLYNNGVSAEAVSRVIGKTKDGSGNIKSTFVLQCPLCLNAG